MKSISVYVDRKDGMKAKLFIPSVRVPRPKQTRVARVLLPIFLLTLALILVSSTTQAHGSGGFYLIRAAHADPYVVHVWVSPGFLRTGDVHLDISTFDLSGDPALNVVAQASFVPLQSEARPLVSFAGTPAVQYPYARGAEFRIDTPGMYRLDVAVADADGAGGVVSREVNVAAISVVFKGAVIILFIASFCTALWLLFQTRAFWVGRTVSHQAKLRQIARRSLGHVKSFRGGGVYMSKSHALSLQEHSARWMERLNGAWHAPAVWIYMLIIVAHWMEHVLQIYQIYGLGWAPAKAGGLLGVIYPGLIESETLHFVYDLIQWAGILILLPGFKGTARKFWSVALIFQTWHYIEHVLLMGQYLTKHYLFGADHQISVLELWFPRPELHFTYNLLVFVPMVIAVHYYLQPKLEMLAAMKAAQTREEEAQ